MSPCPHKYSKISKIRTTLIYIHINAFVWQIYMYVFTLTFFSTGIESGLSKVRTFDVRIIAALLYHKISVCLLRTHSIYILFSLIISNENEGPFLVLFCGNPSRNEQDIDLNYKNKSVRWSGLFVEGGIFLVVGVAE